MNYEATKKTGKRTTNEKYTHGEKYVNKKNGYKNKNKSI